MIIAVIPARGGSKRIPRKNVRAFHGRPMIAWTIEAARKSGCFDKIIVSTDDAEIAQIAKNEGAEVPFTRPSDLADDMAPTLPVVQHALVQIIEHYGNVSDACCMYATAPFLSSESIRHGMDLVTAHPESFIFSVASFEFAIQRALKMDPSNRLSLFQPEYANTRSQDLEHAWHDAGQFYWATGKRWLNAKQIMHDGAIGVPLPRHLVQDIDTEEDWEFAERLFAANQLRA